MFAQPYVTIRVALWPIAHIVSDPVNLDRQVRAGAEEIEHEVARSMLLTKAQAARRTAQLFP